ncbi:MAG: HdeD family acid-resistance protein [Monoglobaceae bacterium]
MMNRQAKVLMIISGVLMVLTGVILLCNPRATLVSLAWLIGVFALISGIAAVIFYFTSVKGMIGSGAILFDGIADIILGLLFLNNGFIVAKVLIFIFGLWLAVSGIEKIIHSVDMKKLYFQYWWTELLLGILCSILGICSIITPMTGAIAISILIGIGLILHGITYFAVMWGINNIKGL